MILRPAGLRTVYASGTVQDGYSGNELRMLHLCPMEATGVLGDDCHSILVDSMDLELGKGKSIVR